MESEAQVAHHYFLISADVLFTDKEKGIASAMPVNSMIVSDSREFKQAMLGRANQGAVVTFRQQLPEEALNSVEIVGVRLNVINYLGHMTKAEFEAVPAGLGMAVEG